MARKPKVPLNQTQIPHEPGRKIDPVQAYVEQFGPEKTHEQVEAARRAKKCTCGVVGPGWKHKPGCPAYVRRRR